MKQVMLGDPIKNQQVMVAISTFAHIKQKRVDPVAMKD
jgi:hypothetical protein